MWFWSWHIHYLHPVFVFKTGCDTSLVRRCPHACVQARATGQDRTLIVCHIRCTSGPNGYYCSLLEYNSNGLLMNKNIKYTAKYSIRSVQESTFCINIRHLLKQKKRSIIIGVSLFSPMVFSFNLYIFQS